MAVTTKQMSLLVGTLGVLSFIFGVIAENKKGIISGYSVYRRKTVFISVFCGALDVSVLLSGTPRSTVKGFVSCKYPADPTVALGYLSFGFFLACRASTESVQSGIVIILSLQREVHPMACIVPKHQFLHILPDCFDQSRFTVLETSLGNIVIDLHIKRCPLTCKNFLKLCKIKYYNGCLFHTVDKDFIAQTGDPTGTGCGGDSIFKFLYGDQTRFFNDEICSDLKHTKKGMVAMASAGENRNASQFYITLRDNLDYLDGKKTVFGEVAEGLEILSKINEAYVDVKNRPYKNIRIKHTHILDDPFDDQPELAKLVPDASPEGKPKDEVDDEVRLEDDWVPMDECLSARELEEVLREKEARASAVVLEILEDIPAFDTVFPNRVDFSQSVSKSWNHMSREGKRYKRDESDYRSSRNDDRRGSTGLAAAMLLWPTITEHKHLISNVHYNLETTCPTAKTGLLGGGAFLALDAALFWLVSLMLADNAREDYFDDVKGAGGDALTSEYDSDGVIKGNA
ncbi:peptidyl-prolyl cis-trans isomerase CYP59 [Tanacetum coccineum]